MDRSIELPEKITVHAGKTSFDIHAGDIPNNEYLALCISLRFFVEEGVVC